MRKSVACVCCVGTVGKREREKEREREREREIYVYLSYVYSENTVSGW